MAKYGGQNTITYLVTLIKTALATKVDKDGSKTLTTNDLTNALKTSYDSAATHAGSAHAPSNAERNVVAGIKRNGAAVVPGGDRVVDISVPTKTSDLTNDSSFITADQVPDGAAASSSLPAMDGAASVGVETGFARGDHVHPTDTTRAAASHTHAAAAVTGLSAVATSGSYEDLSGKPVIPADNSQLANGAGYQTAAQVQSAINNAVASTYKPCGSVAYASLPALSAAATGDVYNVTNAFTTTADFVEGAGRSHPAGSNVVCVEVSGAKKWDVLAGFVDLSGYVQTANLTEMTNSEVDAIWNA